MGMKTTTGFEVRGNQAERSVDRKNEVNVSLTPSVTNCASLLKPRHGLEPSTVQKEGFSAAPSTPISPTPLSRSVLADAGGHLDNLLTDRPRSV